MRRRRDNMCWVSNGQDTVVVEDKLGKAGEQCLPWKTWAVLLESTVSMLKEGSSIGDQGLQAVFKQKLGKRIIAMALKVRPA